MTVPWDVFRPTRSWLRLLPPRGCPLGLCVTKARSRLAPGVASLRANLLVRPGTAWGRVATCPAQLSWSLVLHSFRGTLGHTSRASVLYPFG